jgi:hypothetical protein
MNMQMSVTEPTDSAARMSGQKSMRYLYIVSKAASAQSEQIFAAMRRDMAIAAVELLYDRRTGERRSREGNVDQDRRRSDDRRRRDAAEEIARAGWARIQVD